GAGGRDGSGSSESPPADEGTSASNAESQAEGGGVSTMVSERPQGGDRPRGDRRPSREERRRDRERRREREREEREEELATAPVRSGVLDVLPEGYGFLRASGYLPGTGDVYVSLSQIRRFGLRRGDEITGAVRNPRDNEKYPALLRIDTVAGVDPET